MSQPNFDMATPPKFRRKYEYVHLTPDHYSTASSSISPPPLSHITSSRAPSSQAPSSQAPFSHAASSRVSYDPAPSNTSGASSDSERTILEIRDGDHLRSAVLSRAHRRQPSPHHTVVQSESTPSTLRADKSDSFARGLLERKHTTELKQLYERHDSEARELAEDVQEYGESKAKMFSVESGIPKKADHSKAVTERSTRGGRALVLVVRLVFAALLGLCGFVALLGLCGLALGKTHYADHSCGLV